jgi:hypothetical protein
MNKNGYWIFPDPEKSLSNSARDGSSSQLYQQEGEPQQRPDTEPSTFHGYDCTVDCSGHKAGHDWAEEHEITDGDDCDSAGEHYNSPSFAEGCHAYVDGDSASPSDDDSDNQTPDYDQDAEP